MTSAAEIFGGIATMIMMHRTKFRIEFDKLSKHIDERIDEPQSFAAAISKKGSSWNRVGSFEGLKGHKARYFRGILHFCRVENLAQLPDVKTIETPSATLGYVFI